MIKWIWVKNILILHYIELANIFLHDFSLKSASGRANVARRAPRALVYMYKMYRISEHRGVRLCYKTNFQYRKKTWTVSWSALEIILRLPTKEWVLSTVQSLIARGERIGTSDSTSLKEGVLYAANIGLNWNLVEKSDLWILGTW